MEETIYSAVSDLIAYGIRNGLITDYDEIVVRNSIMDILCLTEWNDQECMRNTDKSIDDILDSIVQYACEKGLIENTVNSKDLFDTKIMGCFTPMPREIIAKFRQRYEISPKDATDWYYQCSQALNYVRAGRIAKDLKWKYPCEYGLLDITINCSKPEKDPRDIAAAKNKQSSSYPKCQLCSENAGFAGTVTHPARQNLRPIPIDVYKETWEMQFSPYGYYNEHCIVFNKKHIPMKIDAEIFDKLFDVIDYVPHYFVGSNADLPIVGGSILSHEHFQGGRYTFAMNKAPVEHNFELSKYPNVCAGIVKWPMSVIRLCSENRDDLSACCNYVLEKWRQYSDPAVFIWSESEGAQHNTITPIARKNGREYVCDLVLRNNITTEDRPLGLFHPNPELHHIKKENIGLIEVMGLAVLPSRLAKMMDLIEKAVIDGQNILSVPGLEQHTKWLTNITNKYADLNVSNIRNILEQEIGQVFLEVLMDAGVFKRTDEGNAAFMRFVSYINN